MSSKGEPTGSDSEREGGQRGQGRRTPGLVGLRLCGRKPEACGRCPGPAPGSGTHLAGDVVHIGAGVASETVAALALLHDQPVPAARAEEQHDSRIGPAGSRQPPRPVGRRPYAHLELTLVRASPSAHQ